MMTRKHYKAVAERLAALHDRAETPSEAVTVAKVARDLAELYAADNPRFSAWRFFTACGLTDNGQTMRAFE